MVGSYVVTFGGHSVGKVQVLREGLYYRFICRCILTGDVVFKLMVRCGGKEESLGILAPAGDGFGLETRLASKRLADGEPEFWVAPNRVAMPGKFIPVYPEEPFAYLSRLKDAYLARRNGQLGVVIQEKAGT